MVILSCIQGQKEAETIPCNTLTGRDLHLSSFFLVPLLSFLAHNHSTAEPQLKMGVTGGDIIIYEMDEIGHITVSTSREAWKTHVRIARLLLLVWMKYSARILHNSVTLCSVLEQSLMFAVGMKAFLSPSKTC